MGLLQKNTSQYTLEYLVRTPGTSISNPPLVILLHGVGSNEQDLFALASHFPQEYIVVSARGPLVVGINQFAWFSTSIKDGERHINPEEAESSRLKLLDFMQELKAEYQYDPAQVYLVGFSQGAIMSYSVALTAASFVKGMVAMSGRLLAETQAKALADADLSKLRVFITHGIEDPVIPISYAREAKEFLESKQISPTYKEYHAEHGIHDEMIQDVNQWLTS